MKIAVMIRWKPDLYDDTPEMYDDTPEMYDDSQIFMMIWRICMMIWRICMRIRDMFECVLWGYSQRWKPEMYDNTLEMHDETPEVSDDISLMYGRYAWQGDRYDIRHFYEGPVHTSILAVGDVICKIIFQKNYYGAFLILPFSVKYIIPIFHGILPLPRGPPKRETLLFIVTTKSESLERHTAFQWRHFLHNLNKCDQSNTLLEQKMLLQRFLVVVQRYGTQG